MPNFIILSGQFFLLFYILPFAAAYLQFSLFGLATAKAPKRKKDPFGSQTVDIGRPSKKVHPRVLLRYRLRYE